MTTTRPFGRRSATAVAFAYAAALFAGAALPGIAQAGLGGAPMPTPPGASVVDLGHGPVAAARIANPAVGASSSLSLSSQPSSGTAPYTVRQTTLASGTVVREYLTSDGTAFGVAWSGPRLPDLSALLGGYFPQYVSTVRANRQSGRMRGPGVATGDGLVVHSSGHMGAFSGEAWLPQALPAGVAASDIQ